MFDAADGPAADRDRDGPGHALPGAVGDPATLDWLDGFCAAIHGYRKRTNAEAAPGRSTPSSVEEAQNALSEELGGIADRTGEVVDRLTALPPAPVPLAETVRKAFVTEVHDGPRPSARREDDSGRREAGRRGFAGPGGQALEQAQQDIDGTYDPVAPLVESPELLIAAAGAPGCKA